MKTIYFDCEMGVAGDMLMSALIELAPNPNSFISKINNLGIAGISVKAEKTFSHGMAGTHISVSWNGYEEQSYDVKAGRYPQVNNIERGFGDPIKIEMLLTSLPLSHNIIKNTIAVLHLIFKAESQVHGIDMKEIHDSRLGTMDAVIDVMGCCMLIDELNPEQILASPINTGYGQIYCRRGILPVPAPATEYLLDGIPSYRGKIQGELCTPTGAALMRYFVNAFGSIQDMNVIKKGCGIGSKDFGVPGGLHVHLGEYHVIRKH